MEKTIKLLELLKEVTDDNFKEYPQGMIDTLKKNHPLGKGQKTWILKAVEIRLLGSKHV
jgi:hypothetical protein